MNATQILSKSEVLLVLQDLHRRGRRSANSRLNLIVFRLSCCCGLRVKEISGLNCGDVMLGSRPAIHIRKAITKGEAGRRKARIVPLWWDQGTRDDIARWLEYRQECGADAASPLLIGQSRGMRRRLTRSALQRRWRTAIRCLGAERVRQLHIHCGRHSFCSLSLAAGRNLIEVRDAAGHSNVATTSIYLHACGDRELPDVFGS